MKVIKGDHIINATQKAFDVIYKGEGYEIYSEKVEDEVVEVTEEVEDEVVEVTEEVEDEVVEVTEEVEDEVVEVTEEVEDKIEYDNITRAEIMTKLTKLGIEYNSKDNKQVLFNLLGSD